MSNRPKRKTKLEIEAEQELEQVNARFFADDLKVIRALAAEERIPWQLKLRLLVHNAISTPRRGRYVK